MKTTIVCGVDFSAQSAKALRYAQALGRAGHGRVRAVHAVDPMLMAAAVYSGTPFVTRAKTNLTRFVGRALRTSGARDVRCVVRVGRPADVLLEEARRCRPSMIVVGTHGTRGVARVFLGSIAQAVVKRAVVPVLVIPRRVRSG